MQLWRQAGRTGALGIEIVCAVVLGTLGGQFLDAHFGSTPVGLLAGFFIGLGAAVLGVRRAIRGRAE
jgi:F0F1-type ATP synthase assembly protein I